MSEYDPCDDQNSLDLGHGHRLRFTVWAPDRELNPQYAGIPDVDPIGAIVSHPRADGKPGRCWSGITFRGTPASHLFKEAALWDLVSKEPLTMSPSLLCRECGNHGFIREGKWVPA